MESSLELHAAVCCNDNEQLQVLLDSGQFTANEKDVEWGYRTPLHWAAQKGYVECAKQLLDFGANGTARMAYAATPAHIAAEAGKLLILKLFVKSKVSVTRSDDFGDRPIDRARMYGHAQCIAYLKQAEAEALERRRNRAEIALQKKLQAQLQAQNNSESQTGSPRSKQKKVSSQKKSSSSVASGVSTESLLSTTSSLTLTDDMIVVSDEDVNDDPIPYSDEAYIAWMDKNRPVNAKPDSSEASRRQTLTVQTQPTAGKQHRPSMAVAGPSEQQEIADAAKKQSAPSGKVQRPSLAVMGSIAELPSDSNPTSRPITPQLVVAPGKKHRPSMATTGSISEHQPNPIDSHKHHRPSIAVAGPGDQQALENTVKQARPSTSKPRRPSTAVPKTVEEAAKSQQSSEQPKMEPLLNKEKEPLTRQHSGAKAPKPEQSPTEKEPLTRQHSGAKAQSKPEHSPPEKQPLTRQHSGAKAPKPEQSPPEKQPLTRQNSAAKAQSKPSEQVPSEQPPAPSSEKQPLTRQHSAAKTQSKTSEQSPTAPTPSEKQPLSRQHSGSKSQKPSILVTSAA